MKNWIQNSLSFKLCLIAILSLLLLIPAMMIQDTIQERETRRRSVIREVSQKWGYSQTITGPFISVPFVEEYLDNGTLRKLKRNAHFLPDELLIDANVEPEKLKRSLYEVILYKGNFKINANFKELDFAKLNIKPENIVWEEAKLCMGIPDLRGISEQIKFKIKEGETLEAESGLPNGDLVHAGVSAKIDSSLQNAFELSIDLNLNGSDNLAFIPMGKSTKVKMASSWPSPSFNGAFIPKNREITDQGFQADWAVLDLNRNFPQQFIGAQTGILDSGFGLRLIEPVDQYQKAYRSVKYAFLFISLTFLMFFFAEIKRKIKIHPIQYALVGLALVVFYTLLISLSEHISLNSSFLIAALAVVFMITTYAASIVRHKGFVITIGSGISGLYIFLFTILQLEDYSLLMGSIGLFLIVGLLMMGSKKVDWYGHQKEDAGELLAEGS